MHKLAHEQSPTVDLTRGARRSGPDSSVLLDSTASSERSTRPLTRRSARLELAKQAEFLYKTQDPAEQRRLLETVLSNCTFDRRSLYPTYSKPFDIFAKAVETGDWLGGRDSNSEPACFLTW